MSEENIHRALQRQIKKHKLNSKNDASKPDLDGFIKAINKLLHQADETRYTLERSMDVSSAEMRDLYNDLQDTSRKLLQSEQSKLEAVIDSIDYGVCAVNKSGKILFINHAAEQLLNTKIKNGRQLLSRITAQDNHGRTLNSRELTHRAFNGESLTDYAAQLKNVDDTTTDISVSLNPLITTESQVDGVVLTLQDLTEHKQHLKDLAEALNKANAAVETKSTFLATMSHEIRTPLNGVIGMLELLLTSELNSQQKDYAEIARTSGDSLLSVLNDILDFSKLEAGQVEIEQVEFNPIQLTEEVARSLSVKALKTKTVLSTYASSQVPEMCVGDLGRIRQVLLNLVGNAVKFTKNGEVQIKISSKPLNRFSNDSVRENICFEVVDTGIGIEKSSQKKLFEPFSQVDASTTRKFGGTGLGLAISKELVELMNGNISVTSEVGVGTNFKFSVPITKIYGRKTVEALNLKIPEGLKILIVDDNATNRMIVRQYLERIQCEIFEADDGDTALEILEYSNKNYPNFDLVITDAKMQRVDGVELVQKIRADRRISDLKIIALSSIPQTSQDYKALANLVDVAILKPVQKTALFNAVGKCINQDKNKIECHSDIEKNSTNQIQLNFLVAEDSTTNQLVINALLKNLGHKAKIVENGLQAVEEVQLNNYDAILMDCMMPVLDGYEATKTIRNLQNAQKNIYIIALTANALAEDKQKCIDAGMNDYVSKPISIQALKEALEKIQIPVDSSI